MYRCLSRCIIQCIFSECSIYCVSFLLSFPIQVWGTGIQELTRTSNFSSPPQRTSLFSANYQNSEIETKGFISFLGSGKELLDTLYFHWQKTGGLYDFSNQSMACRYRSKHTFAVSRSKSSKGVEATLWDVPQWRDGQSGNCSGSKEKNRKRLLVFNTHLDPWHAANRRAQIREIFHFIEDTLQSIESIHAKDKEDSPPSFYKGEELEYRKHDWSQTGVMVVGDFNIKAGSKEYWETLEYMESVSTPSDGNSSWIDYFSFPGGADDGSEDQHTYALQNLLVEYPKDCGRIDYIFGIQRFGNLPKAMVGTTLQQSESPRIFMPLNAVSSLIRKEPIGAESSDHYALILEVIPAI